MDDKCEYDHSNAMNKVMNEISQHGMDTIYLLANILECVILKPLGVKQSYIYGTELVDQNKPELIHFWIRWHLFITNMILNISECLCFIMKCLPSIIKLALPRHYEKNCTLKLGVKKSLIMKKNHSPPRIKWSAPNLIIAEALFF